MWAVRLSIDNAYVKVRKKEEKKNDREDQTTNLTTFIIF